PDRSTSPGMPTPMASTGCAARNSPTTSTMASRMGAAPFGVGRRTDSPTRRPLLSMTTPRILVPPTSTPTATLMLCVRLVAQQGADAAEHVEIGVPDADLDPRRLRQRVFDGFFDHVVDRDHFFTTASTLTAHVGETQTPVASPTCFRIALRDEQ